MLSCPQVMTLDSQTAAVSIGQDMPIVGSTNVTATGLVTTAVDRRNVGVLLRVTPRITPDGKVLDAGVPGNLDRHPDAGDTGRRRDQHRVQHPAGGNVRASPRTARRSSSAA